jgi:hypothetical protein
VTHSWTPTRLLLALLLALLLPAASAGLVSTTERSAAGTLCVESTTQHVGGRTITTPEICVPDAQDPDHSQG